MKKELIEKAACCNILYNHRTVDRSAYGSELANFGKCNFIQGAEWMLQQFQWISVEDKFPTYEDGLVIIRCQNKNKEDGISLFDICYIDEETNTWGKRHHTWENITHWLPIPEFNQK